MMVLDVLLVLGVIFLCLVMVLVATILIDSIVSEFVPAGTISSTTIDGIGNEVTIVLPGILARCEEQIAPILDVFTSSGPVILFDYVGLRLDAERVYEEVSYEIEKQALRGNVVHLVGISLGGTLTLGVVAHCSASHDALHAVSIIDAPAGAKTLSPLPVPIAGVASFLLQNLRPGILSNIWGSLILKLMAVPPKPENIEVPEGEDIDAYREYVISQAKRNLSGHAFSMWWSQLAFMCSRESMQFSELSVVPATYYWCGLGDENANDTVRQPAALEAWIGAIDCFVRVESAHAGFLERQPTWKHVLSGN